MRSPTRRVTAPSRSREVRTRSRSTTRVRAPSRTPRRARTTRKTRDARRELGRSSILSAKVTFTRAGLLSFGDASRSIHSSDFALYSEIVKKGFHGSIKRFLVNPANVVGHQHWLQGCDCVGSSTKDPSLRYTSSLPRNTATLVAFDLGADDAAAGPRYVRTWLEEVAEHQCHLPMGCLSHAASSNRSLTASIFCSALR